MKRIKDAAITIIENNSVLHFGFYHRLLNLSQVARFLRPLIAARTRKEVSDSAVLMSLSRMQSTLSPPVSTDKLVLNKINIHTGLCSLTVLKKPEIHSELGSIFSKVRRRGRFITVTEGINEITIILEDEDFELANQILSTPPGYVYRNIASVGVRFSDETIVNPGVIYQLIQQVALQKINIIEVASTATEFNVYLRSEDVRLAFDSIYQRFSKRVGGSSDI